MSGVGAPKGGRVHWFQINLSWYVKKHYDLQGNYNYHNYIMIRKFKCNDNKERNKQIIFQVIRTSLRCWRVSYTFWETGDSDYIAFKTSKEAAEYINILAEEVEKIKVVNGNEIDDYIKTYKLKWLKDNGAKTKYIFKNDF